MQFIYLSGFLAFLKTAIFAFGYISNNSLFPEPLSAQEESEYLQKYMDGDEEARNILIERNLRLVAHVAKKYGNSNVETDLIVYNTLKVEDMLEIDSYEKTVEQIESEMDAILTDEFLGESSGTRIYPTNSNPDLIKRQEIEKIEFVNNLDNLIEGEIPKVWDTTEKEWNIKTGIQRVWDISAQGDKSILAWTTQTAAPYTVAQWLPRW